MENRDESIVELVVGNVLGHAEVGDEELFELGGFIVSFNTFEEVGVVENTDNDMRSFRL